MFVTEKKKKYVEVEEDAQVIICDQCGRPIDVESGIPLAVLLERTVTKKPYLVHFHNDAEKNTWLLQHSPPAP